MTKHVPERGTMTALTADLEFSDEDRAAIAQADAYMDEALDAVDDEEPTLLEWLKNDPELEQLCWANRSVTYWLIRDGLKNGVPLSTMTYMLGALFSRVLAATAWRATMRAREGQDHP